MPPPPRPAARGLADATARGGLWMVCAGACWAVMSGMIRYLADELHPFEIAFFRVLFGAFLMLGWAAALSGLGTLAHLCMSQAYARAEASALARFDFAQLPFVALVGYLAWAEVPDLWTAAGALVIGASAVALARQEARAPGGSGR